MGSFFRRTFVASLLTFACVSFTVAQEMEVSGLVTEAETGEPLPGVNIVVQGTTTGTTTGLDGVYSITVPGEDAVLIFSFIGYEAQEIPVDGREVIDVTMGEDVALLEDVVVVGYGTQRREDVTGSVSTVDVEDANVGLVTSPTQMLQGRVAGLQVTQTNGEPGAGLNVRIRGGTSINASNEPLYVIDGVPIDNGATEPGGANVSNSAPRNALNLINPNDIESITVLKDASATAIYGSRAANGVILITTKQGVSGRATVDYESYVSASTMARNLDLLSADEYVSFVEQAQSRDLIPNAVVGEASTDWQDAVTRTGVSQFHNLAFSGGTENTQYRASLSYLNQEGIIISSGLSRLTGRLNASNQALDGRLSLSLNLQAARVENDYIPYTSTGGFEGGLFTNVLGFNPTLPVFNEDGSFYEVGPGRQGVRNPVALARQVDDTGETTRTLGNLQAEFELVEGLTAQVNAGADRSVGARRQFFPQASPVGFEFGGQAILRDQERTTQTLQTYLTYTGTLADIHNLNLLGGYEFNQADIEGLGVEGREFVTDATGYSNLAGAGQLVNSNTFSFKERSRLVSFFGRINYNFNERYYLTGVLRYDGSSRFGANNKWALFPALSASWRIDQEPFLENVDAISELRLRLGYGVNGNQEIGNRRSLALLRADPGASAVIGGQDVTGVTLAAYANPDLKWEQAVQYNVGLDYGFLDGKYSGTLEYYLKNTEDLLLEIPVPQPAPIPVRLENIGAIRNQGVEFSLDAFLIDRPNVSWLSGIVMSAERNEVVSLGSRDRIVTGNVSGRGQSGTQAQIILPGYGVPSFYAPVFAGLCGVDIPVTEAPCNEIEDIPDTPFDDREGVQVFNDYGEDTDGDGIGDEFVGLVLPGALGGEDRQIVGSPRPDFTFGWRNQIYFGRFDLSAFIRAEFGRDIFNNTALVYQTQSSLNQNNNFLAGALNDPLNLAEPAVFSSRWIVDGSFVRLQNVTLGYAVPLENLVSQFRNARIYLSVDNALLFTGYDGYDPEVNTDAGLATLGIDYTNYPVPRTFTFGLNLGF